VVPAPVVVPPPVIVKPPPGPALRPVPDVVGANRARAVQVLRDDGLSVGSVTQEVSDRPTGTVLRTNPRAGTAVWPGSSVDLVIAKRDGQVKVPSVVGMDQKDAKRVLTDGGLKVGSVTEKEVPDRAPGTVLSTNPAAGTAVRTGSTVDLVVAKAPTNESGPGGEAAQKPGAVANRRDKGTG
jgi:serine/threonine-protein kinase